MSQTQHAGLAFWEVDEVGRDQDKGQERQEGRQKRLDDPYQDTRKQ